MRKVNLGFWLNFRLILGVMVLAVAALALGCTAQEAQKATTSADQDVPLRLKTVWAGSYKDDIQPIFDRYCVECHGPKREENNLRLDSYEGVMAGTKFGPVVAPNSSSTSALVYVIDGTASQQIQMPHEGRKLSRNRVANIKAWIDAGAKQ
ncbi:MAG: hypothetical protein M0T85_11700 [Dehalococcoidales bacterium]|nr:hypothetical protein [Dehalococcoidales bacterium]